MKSWVGQIIEEFFKLSEKGPLNRTLSPRLKQFYNRSASSRATCFYFAIKIAGLVNIRGFLKLLVKINMNFKYV